jgi:hypothetical protein
VAAGRLGGRHWLLPDSETVLCSQLAEGLGELAAQLLVFLLELPGPLDRGLQAPGE